MNLTFQYGSGGHGVDMPDGCTIVAPRHVPALGNEQAGFIGALNNPVDSPALHALLRPHSRVCIVFTDVTRPTPNHRIIPWLLDYLHQRGVPDSHILLLAATGTHRPNTAKELKRLLTPQVVDRYRVVNHHCDRAQDLVHLGASHRGTPLWINRHFLEADIRIVTGFIEPHFFAGFSGGPKGIVPGLAGFETVMTNHGYQNIASDKAAFGELHDNPIWMDLADMARMAGRCFLVNVTLNKDRHLTGVFAGELFSAHARGCEFVRRSAMARITSPADIVVTSNNGYPLDQNLYQSVKGMCAAGRIVRSGGLIIMAAECREGLPAGSPFERLLHSVPDMTTLTESMSKPNFREPEQWQAQILGRIQAHARLSLFSSMSPEDVRRAHLIPCPDIAAAIQEERGRLGRQPSIVAMPEGPMVIPYLNDQQ